MHTVCSQGMPPESGAFSSSCTSLAKMSCSSTDPAAATSAVGKEAAAVLGAMSSASALVGLTPGLQGVLLDASSVPKGRPQEVGLGAVLKTGLAAVAAAAVVLAPADSVWNIAPNTGGTWLVPKLNAGNASLLQSAKGFGLAGARSPPKAGICASLLSADCAGEGLKLNVDGVRCTVFRLLTAWLQAGFDVPLDAAALPKEGAGAFSGGVVAPGSTAEDAASETAVKGACNAAGGLLCIEGARSWGADN